MVILENDDLNPHSAKHIERRAWFIKTAERSINTCVGIIRCIEQVIDAEKNGTFKLVTFGFLS